MKRKIGQSEEAGNTAHRCILRVFAYLPGNEISSLWADGTEHAGHFLRRHALPVQVAGRRPRDKIPADNQANLEACIHRALELGINHIETARGYGTSEMQLGKVLPKLPREKMIVQTKVSPKATAAEFLKTFETSMDYLRLDYVDLFRCTASTIANCWIGRSKKAAAWKRRANCRRKAARGSSVFRRTRRRTSFSKRFNSGDFDYMNLHWYFVNDLNWPAVEAAHARDMGVFIISPNDKGGKLYEPLGEDDGVVRAADADAVQ